MSGRNSASVSCPRSSLVFCGVGSACVLVIRDDEMGAAYILSSCLIARRAVSSELAEEDTGGVGGRLNDVAFDRMPGTELYEAYQCPPLRAKHPPVISFLAIAMFPHHLYAIPGLGQRAHIMVLKLGSQSNLDLALSPLLYRSASWRICQLVAGLYV